MVKLILVKIFSELYVLFRLLVISGVCLYVVGVGNLIWVILLVICFLLSVVII